VTPYKKRAIPEATRRAVALAAGAAPGESSVLACHYCGAAGSSYWPRLSDGRPGAWVHFTGLELDHVVPERLGGTSLPDNVVLACRPCNRSKKDRTLAEWRGGV
jgi:5-methylcytosine-specific restriction endonuclease McrA